MKKVISFKEDFILSVLVSPHELSRITNSLCDNKYDWHSTRSGISPAMIELNITVNAANCSGAVNIVTES